MMLLRIVASRVSVMRKVGNLLSKYFLGTFVAISAIKEFLYALLSSFL